MCIDDRDGLYAGYTLRTIFRFRTVCPMSHSFRIRKCPSTSTVARVLDAGDHPPHNTSHDIEMYPLFYDPLCCSINLAELMKRLVPSQPGLNLSSGSFCTSLQGSLISHRVSCTRCHDSQGHVTVTFNHERLSVDVRGISISFSTAYFEVAAYSHCRIFARCKAQCVFERDGDPAWFCYNEAHYTANLCSLSAPVLSLALRCVTGKSESLHTKTSTIYALVSRFLSVRSAEYASLDDRQLLEVTQSVPVPPGCIGS